MSLLVAMFPIYIMGNFHCIGMCGPIAMLLGKSQFRSFYLLGRLISFTLAGLFAGAFGEVIAISLNAYHLGGWLSITIGMIMALFGIQLITDMQIPQNRHIERLFFPMRGYMSKLLISQEPFPLFFVGFLTIALPCGQTLLVYSACALSGSAWIGTLNGFAFGLLTTPSLYLAMRGSYLLSHIKRYYKPIAGSLSLGIGGIAILRGFAEWGVIPHFGIHPVMIY